MQCKICYAETSFFDTALVLGKYKTIYYQCPCCGVIQTEEPYWLDEAYSEAITDSDIGLIGRNILLSSQTAAVLKLDLLPPVMNKYLFWIMVAVTACL